MKRLALLLGLVTIWPAHFAHAQTMLTSVSLAASATASAASIDYRYTKHTSGSPRTGIHTYYTWDQHIDEQTAVSLPMVLNGSSGNATASGTFYAPTYTATASASTSLSNTPAKAVFTTSYNVSATLNTPLVDHQRVVASAQPGGSFYFTLSNYTNVTVTATGSAKGVVRVFSQSGAGVVVGPLFGAGTITTESSLPPGDYRIDNSLAYSAIQDTQQNVFANPGATSDAYAFTVTFTPGDSDTNTAAISGSVTFDGLVATAAAQTVTFTLRPTDNSGDITQTVSVPASGAFRLSSLPPNQYTLHIKGERYLASNVSVNATDGDVLGVTATLAAGDANNDNAVDVADFGILVGAYGSLESDPAGGYDVRADFNGDGAVDIADFGLLVGTYGASGDL